MNIPLKFSDFVRCLEILEDPKNGTRSYLGGDLEIVKIDEPKNNRFEVKKGATTFKIPYNNCFSIKENAERFKDKLFDYGIIRNEAPKEGLYISKLLDDLTDYEEYLNKPQVGKFEVIDSKDYGDYKIHCKTLKDYILTLKSGEKITIARYPNEPQSGILRSLSHILEFGFKNDLNMRIGAPKEPKDIPLCAYCNKPIYGDKCNCRNVNHPSHYAQGKIECIEAMKAMLTPEEFRGFLRGSIFKYQWRVMDKNGIEDLEKAKWYLDYLIKELRELDKKD